MKLLRRSFVKNTWFLVVALVLWPLKFLGFRRTCGTGKDALGPFFRTGVPFREDLATGYSGKGDVLIVQGTVFADNCESPLAQTTIDLWHAGPNGDYDNTSKDFLFRGRVKTNQAGKYRFRTLMPAHYGSRPRHIHYKVKHPLYSELITQLYFKGDKQIVTDSTSLASNGSERAMPYFKNPEGVFELQFDIYLSP